MNFNTHYKDIKKLLLRPEKRKSSSPNKPDQQQLYKGIYVISRDKETDKNDQLRYKVGMAHGAGGIYRRMDGYKMGFPYPDEFWLHFCVITPKSQDAKKLEKKILSDKSMSPVPNPRNTTQNLEYRIVVKKATLQNSLLRALKNNPKLWDYAVVFGEKGWKILKNSGADLINSGVLSKPATDFTKKPLLYSDVDDFVEAERKQMNRDSSEIIDVNRKQPVNINTIKKGDVVKDKWGLAIVEKVSKKKYFIDVVSEQFPEGYTLFLH